MPGIVIDITRLVDRALQGKIPTGVDRVGLAYVAHFRERAVALVRFAGRWIIFNQGNSQQLFETLLYPGAHFAAKIRYLVVCGYVFNWKAHVNSVLFNVVHSGLNRADYAEKITRRALKPVFFLHDIIPITHPEYCRTGEKKQHVERLKTMIETGHGIVVNSLDTEHQLSTFCAENAQTTPPCLCAPLAPAPLPQPSTTRPLPAPYFVMLGTIEPRKNHLLILNIWRELVQELGAFAPKLVIIGRRGWDCEQVEDMLDRCEPLKDVVIEKSQCEDGELSTWLHHANALLFPSFVEGFGIPLIEALALGIPVIASDLPVFHEIAGEIPDYIHPLDAMSWKRVIAEYIPKNNDRAHAQRERIKNFIAPTWEDHFVKVEAFLVTLRATP